MFLATCLALVPQRTRLRLKAYFYWLIAQNIARQVARGVLHCAMLKKFVAALPQSLRKVELDSTSCNACCNKNVARLDDCGVCYTTQFLVQLVSQQKLRDKLHEKLHSVTPPWGLARQICVHMAGNCQPTSLRSWPSAQGGISPDRPDSFPMWTRNGFSYTIIRVRTRRDNCSSHLNSCIS